MDNPLEKRLADILFHYEEAVRGAVSDASGSLLALAKAEASGMIWLGGIGMVWFIVVTVMCWRGKAAEYWPGLVAFGSLLGCFWLVIHPLWWAILENPQLGVVRDVSRAVRDVAGK